MEEQRSNMEEQIKKDVSSIPETVVKVITNPVGFYKEMPKSGGFTNPLIFMVLLAVAAGLVQAVMSLLGFNVAGMMAMGLLSIIILPILVAIFSFVGAAIVFVIWKIMGSQEPFETAYRCAAYTMAVAPVTAVLGIIPYLGNITSILWPMALLAIASIYVHQRSSNASWAVFGIIGLVFVFMSLSTEYIGRQMVGGLKGLQQEVEKSIGNAEEMTPEEAGKVLGEFMKGLKKATEEE